MAEDTDRDARHVGALRFDAGSLSLNLVATVGRRFAEPVERLTSVERLREWLGGVRLSVKAPLTDKDLDRVRRLREHLDDLFRSVLAGRRPPAASIAEINAAVASCVPRLAATRGDPALARPPSAAGVLERVVALIAADAVRVVAGRDRANLRACAADDCRMIYLAHGRRARRWCSSERCGNRSRVAAHRARTAASSRRQTKVPGS